MLSLRVHSGKLRGAPPMLDSPLGAIGAWPRVVPGASFRPGPRARSQVPARDDHPLPDGIAGRRDEKDEPRGLLQSDPLKINNHSERSLRSATAGKHNQ